MLFHLNGWHASFIMYISDPARNQEDIDTMCLALKKPKGGNFNSLFMRSSSGKKDSIQIREVAAKNNFMSIKNAMRDDQLVGYWIPPRLMGIIPQNADGLEDMRKRPVCS